jgi:hypothetical protein
MLTDYYRLYRQKTDEWQTRPLVREGAPQRQDINFAGENLWSKVPDWARHQDILTDWLTDPLVVMWLWIWLESRLGTADCALSKLAPVKIKVKITLRLAVSQSVSLSLCRVPSGPHDQTLVTVWRLLSCLRGEPFLTRGRVCRLSVCTYISTFYALKLVPSTFSI